MKKVWETPRLIILVRSGSEEAVLSSCKAVGISIGMNQENFSCLTEEQCGACNTIGRS